MPKCIIIAGPNGAGKTTFALKYLPVIGVRHFLNADMIAAGLSPFAPETVAVEAGRLFLAEIETRITAGEDFAFETTLAGKGYLKLIRRLQSLGWTVDLHYLALPTAGFSKRRVAERVAHGGHNIPDADIDRRFPRGLHNLFTSYRMAVDRCFCRLSADEFISLVFEQAGDSLSVYDLDAYERLRNQADC